MAAAVSPVEVVQGAVVFSDIVGFTEYTALQGDEEAVALLALQERLVEEALPPDARVVKEMGDGLLIWFADACAAVRTSLALQRRFEEASNDGPPLWVRMGVHWGRQTLRRDDILGHDVNVAARILDVAGPGEVLISESTLDEVAGELEGVCFDELGPVVMKGIPALVRLFRATVSS